MNYYYTLMNNIQELTTSKPKRSPKYVQLAEKLRKEILDGKFKVGECVPSQEQLVNRHKVALTTVRQAVGVLQNEGLLKSIQGKGIYVQNPAVNQDKHSNSPYTYKIGFLFVGSSLDSHYNHLLQLEIQKQTHNSGINVVFDTYFTDQDGEEQHVRQWTDGLNGVILTGYVDEKLLNLIRENVQHIVVIGGTISENEADVSKVSLRYDSLITQAVSFLAGFGHKNILGIACTDTTLPVLFEEYKAGLSASIQDLHLNGEMRGYTTNGMPEFVKEIIAMSELPTAIVSLGTEHSYRFMTQLIQSGIKVPEQISIIAVGEKRLVQGFKPDLTCMCNPTESIARPAIEAVIRSIKTNVRTLHEVSGVLAMGETCISMRNNL